MATKGTGTLDFEMTKGMDKMSWKFGSTLWAVFERFLPGWWHSLGGLVFLEKNVIAVGP